MPLQVQPLLPAALRQPPLQQLLLPLWYAGAAMSEPCQFPGGLARGKHIAVRSSESVCVAERILCAATSPRIPSGDSGYRVPVPPQHARTPRTPHTPHLPACGGDKQRRGVAIDLVPPPGALLPTEDAVQCRVVGPQVGWNGAQREQRPDAHALLLQQLLLLLLLRRSHAAAVQGVSPTSAARGGAGPRAAG